MEDIDVRDRIPTQVWKEGKLNRVHQEGMLINGQTQVFLEIILQNALRGK